MVAVFPAVTELLAVGALHPAATDQVAATTEGLQMVKPRRSYPISPALCFVVAGADLRHFRRLANGVGMNTCFARVAYQPTHSPQSHCNPLAGGARYELKDAAL